MSQPTPYTPTIDFSQQEAINASGRSTVNTAALDAELANVETTLDELCTNLALMQRDDGRLKDMVVEIHTLDQTVLSLIGGGYQLRGLWAAGTAYAARDIASSGAYTYVCQIAHTSGASFDPQYWVQFGFTSGADAAQAAAAAQVSAGDAEDFAASASASAASATSSAASATSSAATATSAAGTSTTNAAGAAASANNASISAAAAAASAASIALPLAVSSGGTGNTTPSAARTALGAAASGANSDITSLSGLTTPLSVAQGGTGSTTGPTVFDKADPTAVAFTKTGAGTATIKAGTKVSVAGTVVAFATDTVITMPTLTAGADYAIWVKDDATIQADTSFTSAPGAGNWRKIGGFHYAPGGNAAGVAGGDTTPAINAYSFWDLKFRPACPDPRGMTLVAGSFWADIYLLGVDHLTNGTSKYNVSIADGSAPPKIPTKFGGTGSNAYSSLNRWEANEVLQSWGKRSPTYDEFAALAYGTTEATSSGGSDVPTTGVSGTGATNAWNKFTSRWGVIQATGCLWTWGGEFGGGAAGAAWAANTGGRGSTYQMENAVLFGGYWGYTTESGSRCSAWYNSPSGSDLYIGARGVCDHMILD